MHTRLMVIAVSFCISGCNSGTVHRDDRMDSPESSFEAARNSLQRRDLEGYFDSLTDGAARETLSNSIAICFGSSRPEARQFGYEPSIGCRAVLDRHGWLGPKTYSEATNSRSWDEAVAGIAEPRKMAEELEKLHRENNSGSSFVWEYLDSVRLDDIEVSGTTATATARWAKGTTEVRFEKDETGWRFDPRVE